MDIVKMAKWKKDLIAKAWGKCKSLGSISSLSKSKSSNINRSASFKHYLKRSSTTIATTTNIFDSDQKIKRTKNKKKKGANQVAPDGCFSVYVGPEKQRFVVRTECANHPLFGLLLEEAETEYGYNSEGPILLPCDVDLFYKVLAEMESSVDHYDYDDDDQDGFMMRKASPGCSLNILCSPLDKNGVGSYKLLSPSRLLKMNQF